MIIDRVALTTAAQHGFSKLNAGNNQLPDYIVNSKMGETGLGTPYYDSVEFNLDQNIKTSEYVNCVIAVNRRTKITKSLIKGRNNGSIKQMINEDDYDITFNLKLFSPFSFNNNVELDVNGPLKKQIVGKANSQVGAFRQDLRSIGSLVAEPTQIVQTLTNDNPKYQGDYTPDAELETLMSFFTEFNQNITYKHVIVTSLYLNNNLGVNNIIPYSISTSQNTEFTNMYNVIIKAYSDIPDDRASFKSEIIPL